MEMNMTNITNPLTNFVFVNRIQNELELFIKNPEVSPPVLLFHGFPGIGKTSFAKQWSNVVAHDVRYHAMNERGLAHKGDDLILTTHTLASLITSDDKPLSRVYIFDEFHNLAPKQQDAFKVKLESLEENERVIICLNTEPKRTLNKQLTSPILSRCHDIDFNVLETEKEEFIVKCLEHYEHLDRNAIYRMIPDQRRMARENKLMESRKRLCVA
jgi:replication-associated recombination protein RarA